MEIACLVAYRSSNARICLLCRNYKLFSSLKTIVMEMQALVLVLMLNIVFAQDTLTRVLGGAPTTIEKYPILAQLLRDSSQYCAGVILTIHHVISTAHCFHNDNNSGKNYADPSLWQIRVGSSFRTRGGVMHNLKSIILHPDFDKRYYKNDISVIVASKAFTTSRQVRQATIPKQATETKPNSIGTLVGWGMTTNSATSQPEQLQHVPLHIIDHNTCETRYKDISAQITDAMICGGLLDQGGVDGCHGDSGGPLIYNGVVIGLVSFGFSCGHPYYPGVYTKVSHFSDWIVTTIYLNN